MQPVVTRFGLGVRIPGSTPVCDNSVHRAILRFQTAGPQLPVPTNSGRFFIIMCVFVHIFLSLYINK